MALYNNSQVLAARPRNARAAWEAGQNSDLQEKEAAGLRRASRMFEAQFVKMMLGEMRKTLGQNELLNGGFGEEMFTDLLDQERADVIVQGRGIGLSDMLENQLGRAVCRPPAPFKMPTGEDIPPAAAPAPAGTEEPVQEEAALSAASVPEDISLPASPDKSWRPWEGMARLKDSFQAARSARAESADQETTRYAWPVEAELSSAFGPRFHPILRTVRFHQGIDLKAAYGAPVQAAAEGKVIFAGERGGLGRAIVMEHPDGSRTVYGHCSRLQVREGQEILPGQVIARVGRSGLATGAHLHFEIHDPAGQAVDPLLCLAPRGESALARLD